MVAEAIRDSLAQRGFKGKVVHRDIDMTRNDIE
jgi:hypothetical protein